MSLQRKVERNQLRRKWQEHNKGVEKKYRTKFCDFWKWYQKKKRRTA